LEELEVEFSKPKIKYGAESSFSFPSETGIMMDQKQGIDQREYIFHQLNCRHYYIV